MQKSVGNFAPAAVDGAVILGVLAAVAAVDKDDGQWHVVEVGELHRDIYAVLHHEGNAAYRMGATRR